MSELNYTQLKEDFIVNQYAMSTQPTVRFTLFNKEVERLENKYKKDLSLFSRSQIFELIGEFSADSRESLQSKLSMISKYIDYAIDRGFVKTGMNNAYGIASSNLNMYVNHLVAEDKNLTYNDLVRLSNYTRNYQDDVVYWLRFEGCGGSELSEMINLTKSDIDYNNKVLRIRDKKGNVTRELELVWDETLNIIKNAIEQTEYKKYKLPDSQDLMSETIILNESDYIIRPTIRSKSPHMTYMGILTRIKTVAEEWGRPALNSTDIWWSGIYEYAKILKEQYGELKKEHYREIMMKYGTPDNDSYYYKVKRKIRKHT